MVSIEPSPEHLSLCIRVLWSQTALQLQPHLPGNCEAIKKYTKYGVSEYGHVHTGPDFDADGIRVSCCVYSTAWHLFEHVCGLQCMLDA